MKIQIRSITVETDHGNRSIKLTAPISVDPQAGEPMPPHFRGLTEMLWGLLREVADPPQLPPRGAA